MRETNSASMRRARRIASVLRRAVRVYEQPVVEKIGQYGNPFHVLVSTILSTRTQDTTTAGASARLFRRARTPKSLLRLSRPEIERLIYPVGMYPTKARHLREVARLLVDEYRGRVPESEEALLRLPGVGRKVANLVRAVAYNIPAICVDTHVHRISNRLGLVRTKQPEETERALTRVLPRSLWISWNALLVTWGQQVCTPLRPRCSQCPLRTKNLCPQVGVRNPR